MKLDPGRRWLRFRGLTLALEPNPVPGGSGADRTDEATYRSLGDSVTQLAGRLEEVGAPILPTPVWTYHVTFCDLVHEGNLGQVLSAASVTARRVVEALPWLRSGEALSDPATWRRDGFDPLRLAGGALEIRGSALVLTLAPVDAVAMESATAVRAEVGAILEEHTGIVPSAWRPHLTVGYWPGPPTAHVAGVVAGVPAMSGVEIEFDTYALYGFMDMVTYWRI